MTMTDPTADFLTRIRNGLAAQHDAVEAPASRMSKELARILAEQGYIEGFEVAAPEARRAGEHVRVDLRYTDDRKPVISGLRRVSRPGRRTYVDSKHIPKVQGGMGTTIISTSQGLMTGHDARRKGIGGEVVAEVW
jgi:small subunit ribosomal protein S8